MLNNYFKKRKGRLIVVSGPSGVGKGSLCQKLRERISNLAFSVSATTREPREGEVDGVNYHFISKEQFENLIVKDGFVEYSYHFDNYYGTLKKQVEDLLNKGKEVLLEIDVKGGEQVKKMYPESVFIFIMPPTLVELKKRISSRGSETKEEVFNRISRYFEELSYIEKYDYFVINDDIETAVEDLSSIIKTQKLMVGSDIKELVEEITNENF